MSSPTNRKNLRRFTKHFKTGKPKILADEHYAVLNAQSLFHTSRLTHPAATARVLKSGHNSRKIGKRVVKGLWKGFPIYTLTLEERATCPSTCKLWHACYGNHLHWPDRHMHGAALEKALDAELSTLQRKHPRGFVVRLHVLGDFYSVDYVNKWFRWLKQFPALHIFGYTAWQPNTPIGARIATLAAHTWLRFAVRVSDGPQSERATRTIESEDQAGDAIICPAQTNKTECCGTCGLCWGTQRNIAFLIH